MLSKTTFLVLLSIFFSILNFFSTKFFKQEIYPFTHWKLYSQPLGNDYQYTDYRLYGIKNRDTIRIANKNYPNFRSDDFYYFITIESKKINKNKQLTNKRLGDFGDFITKNKFNHYLLIEEFFNPIDIYKDSTNYSKKIIYELKQ